MLAVPDYTLLQRAAETASPRLAQRPPQQQTRIERQPCGDVPPEATAERRESAFTAIGENDEHLLDLELGDILADIAGDVDGANSDGLAHDWVLSGLQPRG